MDSIQSHVGSPRCKTCQSEHHTLEPNAASTTPTSESYFGPTRTFSETTVLPTAMVPVEDEGKEVIYCRTLLNSGSQVTFIRNECVLRLSLHPKKNDVETRWDRRGLPTDHQSTGRSHSTTE